jgi:predicted ATP-binding protein involved in virulence
MRIRRIAATAFRCIDSADVHLERGLNVLYAVNDHGKSTLALALRAAFLLPPGSADAENFLSWFDSQPPSVQIVFEDDEEKTWRVSKTFGSAGKAELDFSKDGTTFTRDCNARQVEENSDRYSAGVFHHQAVGEDRTGFRRVSSRRCSSPNRPTSLKCSNAPWRTIPTNPGERA